MVCRSLDLKDFNDYNTFRGESMKIDFTKFLSRKFLVALLSGALVTLDGVGVLNMRDAGTASLVTVALTYILGESAVDAVRIFKK